MQRRINVIRTGIVLYFLSILAACSPYSLNLPKTGSEDVKTAPPVAPPVAPLAKPASSSKKY